MNSVAPLFFVGSIMSQMGPAIAELHPLDYQKKKKKKTAIITLVISVAPFLLDLHETCR